MLCHEHAYTSKLPYLDAGYSLQAAVEAGEEKKLEILKQREEKRVAATASGELLDSDNEKEEIINEKDNPFLPGLVGSAKVHDEDQLTDFLFSNTDSNTEGRKQKKRRHFDYCLPCDFKEEVRLHQCHQSLLTLLVQLMLCVRLVTGPFKASCLHTCKCQSVQSSK